MSKTDKTSPAPSAATKPDAARRRLLGLTIKGAAIAAPTVITLTSGTAWALSTPCFTDTKYGVTPAPGPGGAYWPTVDGVIADKAGTGKPNVSQFCWESGNTSGVTWGALQVPPPGQIGKTP